MIGVTLLRCEDRTEIVIGHGQRRHREFLEQPLDSPFLVYVLQALIAGSQRTLEK